MQRFIKTIGYLVFVFAIIVSFLPPVSVQAASCVITSAKIYPLSDGMFPFQVKTSNCADWGVKVVITEVDTGIDPNDVAEWANQGDTGFGVISVDATGTTNVLLSPGDDECDNVVNTDCEIKVTLTPIKYGGAQPQLGNEFVMPGTTKYDCLVKDHCNDGRKWSWTTAESLATTCVVTSAVFDKYKDTGYVGQADGDTHYVGSVNAIIVTTKNCAGKDVYVTLVEGSVDSAGDAQDTTLDSTDGEPGVTNVQLTVPASETVRINLRAGEQRCNVGKNPDCVYFIVAGTSPFTSTDELGTGYYSFGKPHGRLAYNCDGSCLDLWTYISDNGVKDGANETDITDGGTLGDPNSACIDKETGQPIEGCYELYGGLAEVLKNKLNLLDGKFDTLKQDSLGGLINGIIAFAIGIAGVLAVGMIMYEGFLYMKSDNINTKIDERGRIVKTILGFLLLLFIYAGLRTINPDLLNLMPNIQNVNFPTGGDPMSLDAATGEGQVTSFKAFAAAHNIICPGTGGTPSIPAVANSMKDNITYSMEHRGEICADDTFCWDCSGFINAIYSCAGVSSPGYTTLSIFAGAEAITSITKTSVNGVALQPGDLLGWTAGSVKGNGDTEDFGHVVMYIGEGKAIESTSGNGGKRAGRAAQIKLADAYGPRLKFIKRAPVSNSTPTTTGSSAPGGAIQSPFIE